MTATPPILLNKQYAEPAVFTAENLLREVRRQKSLERAQVPRICLLDPETAISCAGWFAPRASGATSGGHAITPTCMHSRTRVFASASLGVRSVSNGRPGSALNLAPFRSDPIRH